MLATHSARWTIVAYAVGRYVEIHISNYPINSDKPHAFDAYGQSSGYDWDDNSCNIQLGDRVDAKSQAILRVGFSTFGTWTNTGLINWISWITEKWGDGTHTDTQLYSQMDCTYSIHTHTRTFYALVEQPIGIDRHRRIVLFIHPSSNG